MHRALLTQTIRKSRKSHSLFHGFHRNGLHIAYNVDALRCITTSKQLTNGSLPKILKSIGIRVRNASSTNDAAARPKLDETIKPKKTKSKRSHQTNVTKVTSCSAKQVNATIQIVKPKNLSKLISSAPIVVPLNEENAGVIEEPLLVVPKKFPKNLQNDSDAISQILQSYHEFLQSEKGKTDLHESQNKKRAQEESIVANFKAYINACVNADMKNRAFAVLRNLSAKKIQSRDVDIYSNLLHAYAAIGSWSKLKETCSILTQDEVAFTPQVYAAICECIGRMPGTDEDLLKELKEYLSKAAAQGITMNDIVDKSRLVNDQREHILNALYRVNCRFEPKYYEPPLTYSNPLLKSLNENIKPIKTKINRRSTETTPCQVNKVNGSFTPEELQKFMAEQMKTESDGIILVKNIATDTTPLTEEVRLCRDNLDKLLKQWEADILVAFKRNVAIAQHHMQCRNTNRLNVCPYMKLLPPEQYVEILMDELRLLGEGSSMFSPTTIELYRRLGQKIYSRYKIQQRHKLGIADKVGRLYSEYSRQLCLGCSNDNPRQIWQRINYHERGTGPDIEVPDISWPWSVLCDIGRFMFNILLHDIKIDTNLHGKRAKNSSDMLVPAFYTTFRNRDMKLREEIRPHPLFTKLFRRWHINHLAFATDLVPMVCPPIPWTGKYGGYLTIQANLLRLPFLAGMQLDRINELSSPRQLYPALDALNQLGCVPWRINTRILDLIIDIFNSGGSDKFHVPKPPHSSYLTSVGDDTEDLTEGRHKEPEQLRKEDNMYSLGCDTLYKLSLANHFRDKTFWLPHNMDFRGRVYPVPPHLTHLSSDLIRSFLQFHQTQPLGVDGLRWLKLHCINLTGLKKRNSVQDRLDYAEVVLDDIIDSADNPIEGRQWWLQSDEPWQTLAACMEIANAIRSPDPATYMSRYPIHQDGSCNGLQHYAALGRDKDGAFSVNLAPCEVPQDVYSTVAALVEKARAEDAQRGNTVAKALEGHVKRKVIKQTVMTTVYGVTEYGARLQIEKQLKNVDDFSQVLAKQASFYLARKTFESLGEIFKSANEIQDWFTDCARYITKQRNMHVEWTTPLGLPVVQPYTSKFKQSWKVLSVNNTKQAQVSDRFQKLNKLKEKNAFPPNFIHSLDSCHMMLTSLYCERAGITFVSVHDCFWTHANTVSVMSAICREQFVALHSQPILESLSKSFVERYGRGPKVAQNKRGLGAGPENHIDKDILKQLPEKGEFDLKEVLDSVYFFS